MKSIFVAFLCITLFSLQLFSQHGQIDSTDLKVYEKVDIDASFPGGEREWTKFLQKNLRANVPVDRGAPAGKYTVWVQFIVDKEGNVSNLKPLTNQGYGMEEEVLRTLKLVPKWIPASQNGRYVKCYRKQPITFIVEIDGLSLEVENPEQEIFVNEDRRITVTARNIKPKNLSVTISQGTIIGSDGNYTIRPKKADKILLTVYNKDKELGQYGLAAITREQDSIYRALLEQFKATLKSPSAKIPDDDHHNANDDDDNKVWEKVEIDPVFPGGEIEWTKFVQQNLNSAVPVEKGALEGKYTVWVQLIVDKDGYASNWHALTNQGYGMEEEAIRVLNKVPRWMPGLQNGNRVRAYKKVPFTFIVK